MKKPTLLIPALTVLLGLGLAWADPAPVPPKDAAKAPAPTQPWENSLGMKFVPAGTDGVLFSIWDVRVKDYAAFVKETARDWPTPSFTQTENDPAVNVSWDDAKAFCQWLTKKDQAAGKLAANKQYRLPMDAEWSKAVGVDLNEPTDGTPKDKDGKIKGIYVWGLHWPPPQGSGNFPESLSHDGYANTSPVGSFAANQYGLYDMGGNVWQWCEDKYDPDHDTRVLRGGSWGSGAAFLLLASCRRYIAPSGRGDSGGFRVVVATAP